MWLGAECLFWMAVFQLRHLFELQRPHAYVQHWSFSKHISALSFSQPACYKKYSFTKWIPKPLNFKECSEKSLTGCPVAKILLTFLDGTIWPLYITIRLLRSLCIFYISCKELMTMKQAVINLNNSTSPSVLFLLRHRNSPMIATFSLLKNYILFLYPFIVTLTFHRYFHNELSPIITYVCYNSYKVILSIQ